MTLGVIKINEAKEESIQTFEAKHTQNSEKVLELSKKLDRIETEII